MAMIDMNIVNEEFDRYVSNFDPEDEQIKLKINHIKRVAKKCKMLANYLNLSEEQTLLAEAIGIFHDIGRFKQIEMYHTFCDKDSVNHAELGSKILFEDNLIERFNIEDKYRRIIRLAVLNHNRNEIEKGLTDEEEMFCKLIRDADKLDIFGIFCKYDFEGAFIYKDFDCEEISSKLLYQLKMFHKIDYGDVHNNADQITMAYAYVYDLNYGFSFGYLKENALLEQFAELVCKRFSSERVRRQTREILDDVCLYVENGL